MSCAEVLESQLAHRGSISLAEVNEEAALQRRIDKKFLLTAAELAALIGRLDDDFRVMDIAGRRIFGYSSTYFDTPDFDQFRAHRQGRRRRYKVRSRTYLDSGLCMFETKLKGLRGETDKHRIRYPLEDRYRMNTDARDFLAELLDTRYGLPMPELEPVMEIDYHRGTLVNPASQERLTLDVQLLCRNRSLEVAGPDMVVVETKSANGRGVADRVLAEMGIRDVNMSKYCVGMAMLHPQLPANRWSRLLRKNFSWQREGAPGHRGTQALASQPMDSQALAACSRDITRSPGWISAALP